MKPPDRMLISYGRSYVDEARNTLGVGFQAQFAYSILLGYYWPLHESNYVARLVRDADLIRTTVAELIAFQMQWCEVMPDEMAVHCDNAVCASIAMIDELYLAQLEERNDRRLPR